MIKLSHPDNNSSDFSSYLVTMSIANIQQLSLNCEVDSERLYNYIKEKQKEYPQLKITVDDVCGIWEPSDALLSTGHDFIFLKVGYQLQLFHGEGHPLRDITGQGVGYCHIIACHEPEFIAQGAIELFQHLQTALLFGRILQGKKTYSILRINGKPLITALIIGSNGYFVSVYPVTKENIKKADRRKLIDNCESQSWRKSTAKLTAILISLSQKQKYSATQLPFK